jgi:membrane-associated phospholipid phosphatase
VVTLLTRRPVLAFLAFAWVKGISYSRIYLQHHYVSDVLAGVRFGVCLSITCYGWLAAGMDLQRAALCAFADRRRLADTLCSAASIEVILHLIWAYSSLHGCYSGRINVQLQHHGA